MWHLLDSSPILTFLFVLYVIYLGAVLIFMALMRNCEPRRSDSRPSPPVNSQVFLSPGPGRSYVESDRRFSRVPRSYHVGTDRRLWTVHQRCSIEYAKMLANASERIRL